MDVDPAEVVMELEETFGICIPDQDTEHIRTVGQLINYVTSKVGSVRTAACLTSRTFYQLRRALMAAMPMDRRNVHPASDLEALIPPRRRRAVWKQLWKQGLPIPLGLSARVFNISAVVVGLLSGGVTSALVVIDEKAPILPMFICCLGLIGSAAWLITRPLAVRIRPYQTVGAAVRFLTPSGVRDPGSQMNLSREEVAEKVRSILSRILRMPPARISEELDFIRDF